MTNGNSVDIHMPPYILSTSIIQLVHSFEVNIRICQPEKAMSTEAKPGWTSLSRVD